MKKCPYCAQKIQDAAIVCRFCGRNIEQTNSKKQIENNPPTMFLLNLFGTPFGIIAVYLGIFLIVYVLQLNIPFGTVGSLLFCGSIWAVYLLAANIRKKYYKEDDEDDDEGEEEENAGVAE